MTTFRIEAACLPISLPMLAVSGHRSAGFAVDDAAAGKRPPRGDGLQRLAQIHRRDLEGLAIFGNRAARDHEPLFR
ncbi:hypothetical protein EZV77_28895 [Burkholderia thailandensis]|nr:hypothetical protein A8H32_03740 [Burkholderia thailandensis]MDD1480077.1 hypothetical protein [Burkholderia thailandensis]MDD1487233.1 hypothetical protein [Burkholderia thailandensis]MDD1493369.1 hypothetical protein [Burkholderia thailandensis]PJO72237.1 hypothetical protein CWD92_10095 [Burkholderia thailandensis]